MQTYESQVVKVVQETADSYSFICQVPEGYTWRAGQHTSWIFPQFSEDSKENRRIFTIASAPCDGFLMFTTRIRDPHSDYKEALLKEVEPGTKLLVGPAMGKYQFHEDKKKHLCVAGGIGITPIRSLVKNLDAHPLEEHDIVLVYSDDSGEYCYEPFWKEAQEKHPAFKVEWVASVQACTDTVLAYAKKNGNEAEYLVAGSPGMNKAYEKELVQAGIQKENIILDHFMGY